MLCSAEREARQGRPGRAGARVCRLFRCCKATVSWRGGHPASVRRPPSCSLGGGEAAAAGRAHITTGGRSVSLERKIKEVRTPPPVQETTAPQGKCVHPAGRGALAARQGARRVMSLEITTWQTPGTGSGWEEGRAPQTGWWGGRLCPHAPHTWASQAAGRGHGSRWPVADPADTWCAHQTP